MQEAQKPSLIIVGAGLSGLLTAYLLQDRYTITLLEARSRIGGRILTVIENGEYFDLGPTWVWPHQHQIRTLIESLGLKLFRHFDQGAFAYDAPEGVQYYRSSQTAPSYRIEGGAAQLTNTLLEKLDKVELRLDTKVEKVVQGTEGVTVHTDTGCYQASKVILTLPPRLCAETITFTPALSDSQYAAMAALPTWMGFSAKCILTYATPFWREKGLSGMATSHIGPLSEVHDASSRGKGALFGFYHTGSADHPQEENVKAQLVRLFGEEAGRYESFHYHNWRADPYTSVEADRAPLAAHPQYGLETKISDHIHLCGTECVREEGGYLEGAVISAFRTAKTMM